MSSDNSAQQSAEDIKPQIPEKFPAPQDYKEAYSYRTGIPYPVIESFVQNRENDSLKRAEPELYINRLISTIDSAAKNDFEKVKMIYDAVALLLDYDIEGVNKSQRPSQSWDYILTSGRSVCEGYANLFKFICDKMGILCEKVHGYNRKVSMPYSNEKIQETHAWNIVKIQNYWYLVDCTWGSGAVTNDSEYIRRYSTDWLFTRAYDFIHTHYPTDSSYQLLGNKITEDQFKKLPTFQPALFDNMDLISPIQMSNYVDSSFFFALKKKKENVLVIFYDAKTGERLRHQSLKIEKKDTVYTVFQATHTGKFIGEISYNIGSNDYHPSGYFFVDAKKQSSILYPAPLGSSAKDVEIISPLVAIHADSTYEFKVYVSNKPYVLLYCNGKKNRLTSLGNGLFAKTVKIPRDAKEIVIMVSDEKFGLIEGIAKYKVEH